MKQYCEECGGIKLFLGSAGKNGDLTFVIIILAIYFTSSGVDGLLLREAQSDQRGQLIFSYNNSHSFNIFSIDSQIESEGFSA